MIKINIWINNPGLDWAGVFKDWSLELSESPLVGDRIKLELIKDDEAIVATVTAREWQTDGSLDLECDISDNDWEILRPFVREGNRND